MPHEENGGLLRYRVSQLEIAVKDLSKKVDAMQTRQTSLLITIASSSIVLMITVLVGTGRL